MVHIADPGSRDLIAQVFADHAALNLALVLLLPGCFCFPWCLPPRRARRA